eukprot:3658323-Pyramimonas_sp.AAC.1
MNAAHKKGKRKGKNGKRGGREKENRRQRYYVNDLPSKTASHEPGPRRRKRVGPGGRSQTAWPWAGLSASNASLSELAPPHPY